jgi:hypothetical protein
MSDLFESPAEKEKNTTKEIFCVKCRDNKIHTIFYAERTGSIWEKRTCCFCGTLSQKILSTEEEEIVKLKCAVVSFD